MLADNGSTDATCAVAERVATALGVELVIIHEPKPGKANTLNHALRMVETPYVVTVDADTLLHRQALRRLVARLESAPADTVAVAGAVMIRNSRANLLTRMQEWDYFLGIAAVKRMQGLYQSTLVAQGAFSLYRTDELRTGRRMARRDRRGHRRHVAPHGDRRWVLTEPTAIAFTDAPTQVSHFMRQRARWARGMVEAIRTVPPWRQRRVLSRFISGIDLLIPLLDIGYGLVWVPGLVLAAFGSRSSWASGPSRSFRSRPGVRRLAAVSTPADLLAAAFEGAPQHLRVRHVHPRLSIAVLGRFAGGVCPGDRGAAGAGSSRPVPSHCVPAPTIHFGLQAGLDTDPHPWLDLARKAEDAGFDAFYVADHLGVTASPLPRCAAAGATSTLKFGTYVLNAGVQIRSRSRATRPPSTCSRTGASSSGSAPGTRRRNGR